MSDSIRDGSKQDRDGGSAFPYQRDVTLYDPANPAAPAQTIRGCWTGGMTLRDYLAVMVMQGMLGEQDSPSFAGQTEPQPSVRWNDKLAEFAYSIADAMLHERAK